MGLAAVLSSTQAHQGIVLKEHGRTEIYGVSSPQNPIQHWKILDCLIGLESSGDGEAVGDNGLARNVLQFHEQTFNSFKSRYGLHRLEWDNAWHQIILADKMLEEDMDNITHWTPYLKCV